MDALINNMDLVFIVVFSSGAFIYFKFIKPIELAWQAFFIFGIALVFISIVGASFSYSQQEMLEILLLQKKTEYSVERLLLMGYCTFAFGILSLLDVSIRKLAKRKWFK